MAELHRNIPIHLGWGEGEYTGYTVAFVYSIK